VERQHRLDCSDQRSGDTDVDREHDPHEIGASDRLRGLQGPAPAKDGQPRKQRLVIRAQQVVRPLDRRPQGPLAGIGIPAALEEVEASRQAFQDLRRVEHAGPGMKSLITRIRAERDTQQLTRNPYISLQFSIECKRDN